MYERSPEYFRKYQKLFCFFTSDTVPHFQGMNVETFAYSLHNEQNDYCKLDLPHYHVLAEKEVMKKLDKDFHSMTFLAFSRALKFSCMISQPILCSLVSFLKN